MKRALVLLALSFASIALLAEDLYAEDSIGTHVVKSGETLQGITAHYLGTSRAWQENWKLNPEIRDPNRLVPGQRLRVIIARTLPAQSALIRRVSNHVERKPEPKPWTAAQAGDKLVQRDGVHTFTAASAELRFDDDTTLTLTEQSLVFLREAKAAPSARERSAVEIVDGHADLEKPAKAKKPIDIEIVVGSTTAAPKDPGAKARFRSEAKKAQVMSYRGATTVASAGAEVKVGAGMGVTVPDGEKPPAPEKLLGAPAISAIDVASSRPRLRWPALQGARTYAVEICRDRGCGDLLARAASVNGTEWRSDVALDAGAYFWRVTAKSASGLDGYPAVAALNVKRGIAGTVTLDGRAVEGAAVTLLERGENGPTVRTNANGEYQFRDLTGDQYSVAVDARSVDPRGYAVNVSQVPGNHPLALGMTPVDGIDFAFSINVVTNANDSGPGSLRQFIENANAIPGPNVMQYLGPPATLKLVSPLPRITDVTTIAGRPTDEEIGSVTTVGADETPLRNPSRSTLTIDFGGMAVGFDAAAELTLRDVMLQNAGTFVRAANGLTLDGVVIGELLARRDATGVQATGNVHVRRTLITGMQRVGMSVNGKLDAEDLEINWSGEGLTASAPGARIRHSLFLLNDKGATLAPDAVLESSTFRGNRADGVAQSAGNVFEALTVSAP